MAKAITCRYLGAAMAFVSLFWAGALAGVSFLATPVKFQAASLDLPVALEVGKVTFALFIRCEWGLAALLAISVIFSRTGRLEVACVVGTTILVLAETLWLLPALDARVDAIIVGNALPASPHHMLYAAAEVLKLVLLCTVATAALARLGRA